MRIRCSRQTNQGLTLVEAVAVIFVIAVLAMLLVPALLPPQQRTSKLGCVNNLKQLALAFKIWAGDNNDRYPMEVSVIDGGTKELMDGPDAWKTFLVMSNELSTPKIISCEKDFAHCGYATKFDEGLKNKISYFIGLGVTYKTPNAMLTGDDNFLNQGSPVKPGSFEASTNTAASWDSSRHTSVETYAWFYRKTVGCGNVGLGDGSVQSVNNSGLTKQIRQTGLATNRLVIP